MAYNKSIGTFYGYANGSKYGRYTCTLYWDNVTRKGTQITMNNAYVEMTRYSTAYTKNRIAGKAGIGGSQTNIANNKTLNAYGTQSPATIKFDLGDPVLTTTGTSFNLYIAIASTGGSSGWENFQSTILEATVDISCPSANPTFITKPSITNIEETKLTLNHGTTDIESLFYYKESKNTEWIEMTSSTLILNGLTAATEYSFDFKAVNKTSTDLGKEVSKITATTYQYPYIKNIEKDNIVAGNSQNISLYNPLKRNVSVFMTHETMEGAVICGDDTSETSISLLVPIEQAGLTLPADSLSGTAYYYCQYNDIILSSQNKTGTYSIDKSSPIAPVWENVNFQQLLLYKDGNENVVNITQNNQKLIQKHSKFYYGVNYNQYPATSNYGSEIEKYQISIDGGDFIDITASSNSANIYGIDISEDMISLRIKLRAIDKRGFISNEIEDSISITPYFKPKGNVVAIREGGYGETINLTINPVWAINSNNTGIASYTVQKDEEAEGNIISTQRFNEVISLTNYSNDSSYIFRVTLTDAIGEKSDILIATVGQGVPILFIDSAQVGVGVNCFPNGKGLYVDGETHLKGKVEIDGDATIKNAIVTGYLLSASHRNQTFNTSSGEQRSGWYYEGGE